MPTGNNGRKISAVNGTASVSLTATVYGLKYYCLIQKAAIKDLEQLYEDPYIL